MIFKPGDKVKIEGVLVSRPSADYPLVLHLNGHDNLLSFTEDGRLLDSDSVPVIKLVERPKRMVKKKLTQWVVINRERKVLYIDDSIDDAEDFASGCDERELVKIVEMTGEYEVPEEEK